MINLDQIYFRLAKKSTLYIKLFNNKIEIKHIESGRSLVEHARNKFSNDRLLIADPREATTFCLSLINQLFEHKHKLFPNSLKVVLQPDLSIGNVSPVEKMIYQDFMHSIGTRRGWLYIEKSILTDLEITHFNDWTKFY